MSYSADHVACADWAAATGLQFPARFEKIKTFDALAGSGAGFCGDRTINPVARATRMQSRIAAMPDHAGMCSPKEGGMSHKGYRTAAAPAPEISGHTSTPVCAAAPDRCRPATAGIDPAPASARLCRPAAQAAPPRAGDARIAFSKAAVAHSPPVRAKRRRQVAAHWQQSGSGTDSISPRTVRSRGTCSAATSSRSMRSASVTANDPARYVPASAGIGGDLHDLRHWSASARSAISRASRSGTPPSTPGGDGGTDFLGAVGTDRGPGAAQLCMPSRAISCATTGQPGHASDRCAARVPITNAKMRPPPDKAGSATCRRSCCHRARRSPGIDAGQIEAVSASTAARTTSAATKPAHPSASETNAGPLRLITSLARTVAMISRRSRWRECRRHKARIFAGK